VWAAVGTGQAPLPQQSHACACFVGEVLLKMILSGFALSSVCATDAEDFPATKMSQKKKSLNLTQMPIYLLL